MAELEKNYKSTCYTNIYCPICERKGKNIMLFRKRLYSVGEIEIKCRMCKSIIRISLDGDIQS